MANMNLVTGYWGEEHVTSNDQGSFNAATLGSGEFVTERGNGFAASIISNNKVRVLDGDLIMQGRHIRIDEETYVDLYFDNGTQGYKRNDLIVARYTKDSTTEKEACNLVVIKGTPVESSPADPDYITGDILTEHALQNDMPLFRVPFDGLTIQPLVPLFETVVTWPTLQEQTVEAVTTQVNELVEQVEDDITRLDADITKLDADKCGIITIQTYTISLTIPAYSAKYGTLEFNAGGGGGISPGGGVVFGYKPAFIAGFTTGNIDVVPCAFRLLGTKPSSLGGTYDAEVDYAFRNISSKDQTINAPIYVACIKTYS